MRRYLVGELFVVVLIFSFLLSAVQFLALKRTLKKAQAAPYSVCGRKCGLLGCKSHKCCPPGSFGFGTSPSDCGWPWGCREEAEDPECALCPAGKYKSHADYWSNDCPDKCPDGSMSRRGGTSRLDCTCRVYLSFDGPDGGPCEISRAKLLSQGVIWLYGDDNHQETMSRFGASVQPWQQSLNDSDLAYHVRTWAAEAARFWGSQGPPVEHLPISAWFHPLLKLVLGGKRYKNAFWKDATGLGAWIEVLRNVSTIQHPSLSKFGRIASALDEWRLEDAAQHLAQARDEQGREAWPSTALLHNALVYHDGVVDAPIKVPIRRLDSKFESLFAFLQ